MDHASIIVPAGYLLPKLKIQANDMKDLEKVLSELADG
jgi:hypothetical protein